MLKDSYINDLMNRKENNNDDECYADEDLELFADRKLESDFGSDDELDQVGFKLTEVKIVMSKLVILLLLLLVCYWGI